jgi:hypothetical protein
MRQCAIVLILTEREMPDMPEPLQLCHSLLKCAVLMGQRLRNGEVVASVL